MQEENTCEKKKTQEYIRKLVLTNLPLTLFSFNFKIVQDEGRRLWPEAIKGKSLWAHKIALILNCLRVFDCLLHAPLIPALKFGPSLNCAKQEVKELVAIMVKRNKT